MDNDDEKRRSVIDFSQTQADRITIGDVAGRDINKPTIIQQAPLSDAQRQALRNRAVLLSLVRRFWVEGVLHTSLHQQVRIELGLQLRPNAVDHPWQNIVCLPDQAPHVLPPGQPIRTVFDQAGGRLLILGAPGGGKTTTLLLLAEQLLDAAEDDFTQPIPVVFQLSTWALSLPPLADWLVSELKERYKVPPNVGAAWVAAGEILPLLDGLDEVGPGDAERAVCVRAINTYLGEAGAQTAVCSRSAEYVQAEAHLALEAAIEVQPLKAGQVDAYLAQLGHALAGLRTAVASDTTLGELTASPLLVSVMAMAYRDVPASDLIGQGRQGAYQRLWDDYLMNRFALMRADAKTDPAQLRAWLIWLARGMVAHGQQVFYIEYLQPSWLSTREQHAIFHRLSGLLGGLGFGLLGGLSFGFLGYVASGLRFGLPIGLISCVLIGLLVGRRFGWGKIALTETLFWNGQRARIGYHFRRSGGRALGLGLLGGLLSVSVLGLLGGLSIGLLYSLLFSLLFSLPDILSTGLIADEISISTQPNEGVRRSLRNSLVGSILFGLVFGLLIGLSTGLPIGMTVDIVFGLVFGLACGLLVGLVFGLMMGMSRYGGEGVIKHYILRRLLTRHCVAPWDFVAALDQAVSRTLMTRVGGGYRFIHRLLQDHLAQHMPSDMPIPPILGPQDGDQGSGHRARS